MPHDPQRIRRLKSTPGRLCPAPAVLFMATLTLYLAGGPGKGSSVVASEFATELRPSCWTSRIAFEIVWCEPIPLIRRMTLIPRRPEAASPRNLSAGPQLVEPRVVRWRKSECPYLSVALGICPVYVALDLSGNGFPSHGGWEDAPDAGSPTGCVRMLKFRGRFLAAGMQPEYGTRGRRRSCWGLANRPSAGQCRRYEEGRRGRAAEIGWIWLERRAETVGAGGPDVRRSTTLQSGRAIRSAPRDASGRTSGADHRFAWSYSWTKAFCKAGICCRKRRGRGAHRRKRL